MNNSCLVEGCTRPRKGYGYCEAHLRRFQKHGDPLHGGAEINQAKARPQTKSEKLCSYEGCFKPHSANGLCKLHCEYERRLTFMGKWSRKNESLRLCYKITIDDYITILYDIQGGACALCQAHAPSMYEMLDGKERFWPVDHDHRCCSGHVSRCCGECIRGILCYSCNNAVGAMWEDCFWRFRTLTYIDQLMVCNGQES